MIKEPYLCPTCNGATEENRSFCSEKCNKQWYRSLLAKEYGLPELDDDRCLLNTLALINEGGLLLKSDPIQASQKLMMASRFLEVIRASL